MRKSSLGYNALAWTLAAGLASVLTSKPALAQTTTKISSADSVLHDLIVRRLAAVSAGNGTAYLRLVSTKFVHVDDAGIRRTVHQMPSFIASIGSNHPRFEVGPVDARRFGSIAVVDCAVTEYASAGPRELRSPLHETDVFVLQRGRWLFLNHQETHVLSLPKPAAPNIGALDDYVGRYEWSPGFIDTITRRGNHLYAQQTGDSTATLLYPASGESYFTAGDPSLIIFARNAGGKVTHYILHWPDGQVTLAKKLK